MSAKEILLRSSDLYFSGLSHYSAFAIGRSFMAFSLFLTLSLNGVNILFASTSLGERVPYCEGTSISIFCLLSGRLELARWLSCLILFIVLIGWRPRVTGVLHWWINFSYMTSTPVVDGGEHAATIISLILIPVCLLDDRKWHWQKVGKVEHQAKPIGLRFCQMTFFEIARLQVALIYLHAAVGKTRVTEWIDGTAMWYWLNDPIYGSNDLMRNLINPMLSNQFGVAFVTWGVIILEFLLFVGFFLNSIQKQILLFFGVLLHVSIAVFLGLLSFSLIMIGALFILLYTVEE